MIPDNLKRRHILQAASQIDREGVPWQRRSIHYQVVVDGTCYPPKYIISLANSYANGIEHSSYDFNAVEAINFFRNRGYQVIDRKEPSTIIIASECDVRVYPEGKEKYRQHRKLERNRAVVTKAKESRLADTGRLQCDVWSFDFMEMYGRLGDGFVEAHHKIPVSELGPPSKTKISDLALVCSNCHRMLHRGRRLLKVDELRQIVRTKAPESMGQQGG